MDRERPTLCSAVRVATHPDHVLVLVQLSGELRVMKPPYRRRRRAGWGTTTRGGTRTDPTGVREAALQAILAGGPEFHRLISRPIPSPELLVPDVTAVRHGRIH